MGDYFECELRMEDADKEIFVTKIWLRLLPRVGENIQTVFPHDNLIRNLVVKNVWHLAGDNKVGHRVMIYAEQIYPIKL